VLLDGDLVLVSVDASGTVCWWELERGQCLFKRRYGRHAGVLRACVFVADRQYLCLVMSRTSSTIAVISVESRSLLFEIGGMCFSNIEATDPSPSRPCRLICETEWGDKRAFDFDAMNFSALDTDVDNPAVYMKSHNLLDAEEVDDLRRNNRNTWGVGLPKGTEDLQVMQLGSSDIFLCLEQGPFPEDNRPSSRHSRRASCNESNKNKQNNNEQEVSIDTANFRKGHNSTIASDKKGSDNDDKEEREHSKSTNQNRPLKDLDDDTASLASSLSSCSGSLVAKTPTRRVLKAYRAHELPYGISTPPTPLTTESEDDEERHAEIEPESNSVSSNAGEVLSSQNTELVSSPLPSSTPLGEKDEPLTMMKKVKKKGSQAGKKRSVQSSSRVSGRSSIRKQEAIRRRNRRQVITCKPAPQASWSMSSSPHLVSVPHISGSGSSTPESNAAMEDLVSPSLPKDSRGRTQTSCMYHVLVAASNTSIISLFELDLRTLDTTFMFDFKINLHSVDAMSVSPFGDGKLCIVDEFFDKALVVLNDSYEQVYRVYLGPAHIDAAALRWASPFQIELGYDWSFDLISERVLKSSTLYTSPYVYDVYPPTPPSVNEERNIPAHLHQDAVARRRQRAESVSSTGTASSMAPIPGLSSSCQLGLARASDTHMECGTGISFLEPTPGLKIWTLHMHEITSCTPSLLSLMSFFMVWGLDTDLDKQVERLLHVKPPSHDRYRYLVHALPSMYTVLADNSQRWSCSDKFTASQILGIVSLFISLLSSDSLGERQQALMSSLVSHYGVVFPDKLIKARKYVFPCLDMMSRFILSQHASEDVHVAARLLLQVSVERMPASMRVSRTAQWAARLHMSNGGDRHAVVVLGMMGVTHPEDLAPATARLVAIALRRFVGERNNEDTIIAAELLARGFYVWCPYITDLSGLISDLIMTQDLAGPLGSSQQTGGSTSLGDGHAGSVVPAPGVHASTATGCQRALFEIAGAQPLLFIETVGRDALRPGRHRPALTALSKFIKRNPVALLRHLPAVVELVIKTLDPSESEIRKACLKFSTVVLHQLVKRYPMVSFHQQSQRFAVGTVDSIILIYDLRTATKWRIFEGHIGAVAAVQLEPQNGDSMISYAAQECAIRVWNTGSSVGFFSGLLGIQGSCQKVYKLPRLLGPNNMPAGPFSASDIILNCSLDWNRLVREDGKTRVDLTALQQR